MTIPVFEYSPGLPLAGEDIGHITGYCIDLEPIFKESQKILFQKCRGSGPPIGCGYCEQEDCFYNEFILTYWNYPHSD